MVQRLTKNYVSSIIEKP